MSPFLHIILQLMRTLILVFIYVLNSFLLPVDSFLAKMFETKTELEYRRLLGNCVLRQDKHCQYNQNLANI